MILLQDVKNLGKKGDILESPTAYPATSSCPSAGRPGHRGRHEAREKERVDNAAREARELEAAKQWARELGEQQVEVRVRAGESGKLFGAVTSTDVAEAIKSKFGREVDKRKIQLDSIQTLGEHHVTVKLGSERQRQGLPESRRQDAVTGAGATALAPPVAELQKRVSTLFEFLSNLHGPDKLVLIAGKLHASS